jgi:hypothetical protein
MFATESDSMTKCTLGRLRKRSLKYVKAREECALKFSPTDRSLSALCPYPLLALCGNAIGKQDEGMGNLVGGVVIDPNQQTLPMGSKSTTPII